MRTFRYTGRIERKKLESLLDGLKRSKTPCELIMRSHGGFMEAALWFYDEIKTLGLNITTVADAYVDSSAIIVFLAGTTRVITPDTTMEFHDCVCEVRSGSYSPQRLVDIANAGVEAAIRLQHIVAQASTNRAPEDIAVFMNGTTKISDSLIVELGLAHKIESL